MEGESTPSLAESIIPNNEDKVMRQVGLSMMVSGHTPVERIIQGIVESQGIGEYWQSPQMMLEESSPSDHGQEQ